MNILLKILPRVVGFMPSNMRVNTVNKLIDLMIDKYVNLKIVNYDVVKLRRNKPTIYICNHLSNIDGVILNRILKDNNVAFMAGVKLKDNPLTSMVLDTVNTIPIKPNSADTEAIKRAIDYLKNNGSIFIFPEGTRSRSAEMIEARSGFVLLCKMSGVDIVPVGLEGTEKILPVNDSNMGDEKMYHGDVKVTFGEAFKLPKRTKENKENWKELAKNDAMTRVAKLISKEYRGFYS